MRTAVKISETEMRHVGRRIQRTCDNLVILEFEEFCQSIPNGKQFLDECILPSSRIEGSCPQPEYQVRIIKKHTTCLV